MRKDRARGLSHHQSWFEQNVLISYVPSYPIYPSWMWSSQLLGRGSHPDRHGVPTLLVLERQPLEMECEYTKSFTRKEDLL